MHIPVSEFKAKCTQVLREISMNPNTQVEITNRGKVIAILRPPKPATKVNPAWGSLKGSVTFMSDDFNQPLGDADWAASE